MMESYTRFAGVDGVGRVCAGEVGNSVQWNVQNDGVSATADRTFRAQVSPNLAEKRLGEASESCETKRARQDHGT
jgi:hypothetical protein